MVRFHAAIFASPGPTAWSCSTCPERGQPLERVKGIEPSLSAWESHKIGPWYGVSPGRHGLEWPGVTPVRLG